MKYLIIALLMIAMPVLAVEPDEMLADPVLEQRARDISAEVRCVVCQNEPIDSSNSAVARDLRMIIRERLVAGDSDAQIREFLVERYGTYVLFKPPFKPSTYLLWIAPGVIFFLGLIGLVVNLRTRKPAANPLSEQDEKRVQDILNSLEE